jgi:hypothetical protein
LRAAILRRPAPWILAATLVFASWPALGQVELGIVGGPVWAGRQDLTIEQRDAAGSVIDVTQEPNLHVDRGRTFGLTMVRWSRHHPNFGLSLDALYWANSLKMAVVGSPGINRTLHQERIGLFASLAGRAPVSRSDGSYVYGSIGMGAVDSRLVGGDQRVAVGFSLTAGGAMPLVPGRLFAHLEVRYLITHDFDSDDTMNQNFEFSGSPSWTTARKVFGGHQDTRFLPLLAGLSWRF